MIKSKLSIDTPEIPTRLIIFWAHRPYDTQRVLKRVFTAYGITASNLAVQDGYNQIMDPAQTKLVDCRLKVNHFPPLARQIPSPSTASSSPASSANASAASASAASPSAASAVSPASSTFKMVELDAPEKITHLYAVKIPSDGTDLGTIHVALSEIVEKTFDYIIDYVENCNVQEIIFINETNAFLSGQDLEMLPEIKERFACQIKMCKNINIKQKLSIIDFSSKDKSLAEVEAQRIELHRKNEDRATEVKKIPFIIGLQEGGGGPIVSLLQEQFATLFESAEGSTQARMTSINSLGMALSAKKTLTSFANFTSRGTNFSALAQISSRASTPRSPLSSPKPVTRTLDAAAKASPRATPTPVLEGRCVAEPYYPQWPASSSAAAAIKEPSSVTYRHNSPAASASPARGLPVFSPGTRSPGLPPVPREVLNTQDAGEILLSRNSSAANLASAVSSSSAANLRKASMDSLPSLIHTPHTSLPSSPVAMLSMIGAQASSLIHVEARRASPDIAQPEENPSLVHVEARKASPGITQTEENSPTGQRKRARLALSIDTPLPASTPTSPLAEDSLVTPPSKISRSLPGTVERKPVNAPGRLNSPASKEQQEASPSEVVECSMTPSTFFFSSEKFAERMQSKWGDLSRDDYAHDAPTQDGEKDLGL